jgi:hypothetical protein
MMTKKKRTGLSDTDPAAERVMIELARATPDWKKLQQVVAIKDMCRQLAKCGITERYPGASENEVRLRVYALELDRDTMIEVYDWDPRVKGY